MEILYLIGYGFIGILAGCGLMFILSIKNIIKWKLSYENQNMSRA